LEKLHDQKARMPEPDYYAAMEKILRQLAALYVPTGAATPLPPGTSQPTPAPTT
jgi:hypothetical protein